MTMRIKNCSKNNLDERGAERNLTDKIVPARGWKNRKSEVKWKVFTVSSFRERIGSHLSMYPIVK